MHLKVQVTQHHIDFGVESNCEKCPVALALVEAVPMDVPISVEPELAVIGSAMVDLPRHVTDFIEHFDNGRDCTKCDGMGDIDEPPGLCPRCEGDGHDPDPVQPFEFEIDLPDDYHQ